MKKVKNFEFLKQNFDYIFEIKSNCFALLFESNSLQLEIKTTAENSSISIPENLNISDDNDFELFLDNLSTENNSNNQKKINFNFNSKNNQTQNEKNEYLTTFIRLIDNDFISQKLQKLEMQKGVKEANDFLKTQTSKMNLMRKKNSLIKKLSLNEKIKLTEQKSSIDSLELDSLLLKKMFPLDLKRSDGMNRNTADNLKLPMVQMKEKSKSFVPKVKNKKFIDNENCLFLRICPNFKTLSFDLERVKQLLGLSSVDFVPPISILVKLKYLEELNMCNVTFFCMLEENKLTNNAADTKALEYLRSFSRFFHIYLQKFT